eukprot:INCI16623.2.p2 GENE.INCI16623.2~~INCI16623.2.p2  ORF type:complete len:295 (-),score=63.96 INCI16623.2:2377-3261(-)
MSSNLAFGVADLNATNLSASSVADVPREDELLHWLNTFLRSRYRQIEDLRDSIAFAQIMDAAVPDAIPLDLFDYNASSYESYYRNASILRAALDTVDLSSAGIDADKIAVGQLEANFSLLYFCYTFITNENADAVENYDAMGCREAALASQGLSTMNKFLLRPSHSQNDPQSDDTEPESGIRKSTFDFEEKPLPEQIISRQRDNADGDSERVEELRYLVASLETEMTSRIMALNVLTENIRAVRSERDHYFDKLTGIEKACQLFKNGPDRADAEHLLSLMRVENDSDFQDLAAV